MKLLYKPFAIVAGVVGTKLGKRAFKAVWSRVGDSPSPPAPTSGEAPLAKVAGAAALEAATMAAIAATVNRLSARSFRHLFGAWPDKPTGDS
jgi:Protein of unknown function (DUF4235)